MRAPKRRRISRSDSLANICPSNRRRPNPGDSSGASQVVQENSVSLPRGDVPKAESQGRIFILGSPVRERLSYAMRFGSRYVGGGFLKECYRCEKVIGEKDDIFMYSESAFCSTECREMQIAEDRIFRWPPGNESQPFALGLHKKEKDVLTFSRELKHKKLQF